MEPLKLVTIGLFLPLFPFSMILNSVFARVDNVAFRVIMLLAWPLIGLAMVDRLEPAMEGDTRDWLLLWALLTSALYALRLLVLRELNRWTGFLATSLWALLWVPVSRGDGLEQLQLDAVGFSAPLVLLVVIAVLLTQRFGAAYTGLYNGIADCLPRLSAILVMSVLAATGTPLFPSFFSMLSFLILASPLMATGLLLIWLLWSWAGARMLQGFIVGEPEHGVEVRDIGTALGWLLVIALVAILVVGVSLTGEML